MTHRRRLLKAALAAPGAMVALHPRASAALAMSGNDACLFDLYADWLACEAAMAETFPALTRAEQAASARGVDWDDCPAVGAVLARPAGCALRRSRAPCGVAGRDCAETRFLAAGQWGDAPWSVYRILGQADLLGL